MSFYIPTSYSYSVVAKCILFFSFFILGFPLDGQLGTFSAGSMYIEGEVLDVIADNKNEKIKLVAMTTWGSLYILTFLLYFKRSGSVHNIFYTLPSFTVFLIYMFFSAIWAADTVRGVFEVSQLIGALVFIFFITRYYSGRFTILISHLAIAFGTAQLLSIFFVIALPHIGIAPNGRWCGVYGAPNYFGVLAFFSIWANVAVLKVIRPEKRNIFIIFSIVSIINLLGTNSVTSILCTLLSLSLMYAWPKLFLKNQRSRVNRAICVLLLMFIGLGFLFGVFDTLLESVLSSFGRTANLSGRSYIWGEAIYMIMQEPFLGHGFGSILTLAKIERLNDLHSFYITTLFYGGLVGLILFLFVVFEIVSNVMNTQVSSCDVKRIFVPVLIGILVYSVTETALYSARSPIYLVFIIAIVNLKFISQDVRELYD